MKNIFLLILLFFSFLLGLVSFNVVSAATANFTITPPEGPFTRGQNIDFTIAVDTQGQTVSSTTVGMTYDTQYLQYVSTTPGDAFATVNAETQDGGKIVFNGSNAGGYSGTGTFAVVTFKLIATSSGSTQLCVLYNPATTPVPNPTSAPNPTSGPQPTALPKTGSMNQMAQGAIIGFGLLLILTSGFMLINKPAIKTPYKHKT